MKAVIINDENLPPPSNLKQGKNVPNSVAAKVLNILSTHFDNHQRSPSLTPAPLRAVQIVKDIMAHPNISNLDPLAVESALINFIDLALSSPKTNSIPAESILELCLCLCAQQAINDGGLTPGLDFLLYRGLLRLPSTDDVIRTRATSLIGSTVLRLSESSEDGTVDEETFLLTREALLPRLSDKSTTVRTASIKACKLLQDSEDDADEITQALLYSIMHDTSPVCRSAATECIVVTRATLPTLISRVRDISSSVRVTALEVLRTSVDVRLMNATERVVTLRSGLTPRCEATYKTASKMLSTGWLKSLGYSPLKLLKLLDVADNEVVCELACKAIIAATSNSTLKDISSNEIKAYTAAVSKYIDLNKLTVESALFLRAKCSALKDDAELNAAQRAELMDKIMPDTPVICTAIQKHLGLFVEQVRLLDDTTATATNNNVDEDDSEGGDDSFICLQLLKLVRSADFTEESGRKQVLSLLHNMLCSSQTPDELVESCIRALAVAHRTESEYIQRIAEVISQVSDYDAEDEEMDANDVAFRQLRVVSIIGVVLEHTKRNLKDETIANLCNQILPALASSDNMVREAGVSCLGKYAMLGAEASQQFKPLLLSIADNVKESNEIRAASLLAMCDLAMLWDGMMDECECNMMTMDENEDGAVKTVSLESMLEHILDNESTGMVVIAAEICSKLLIMGRIKDRETFLAKLLLVYFDPKFASGSLSLSSSEEESSSSSSEPMNVAKAAQAQLDFDTDEATEVGSPIRLHQLLSIFFPAFCMLDDRRGLMGDCTRKILELTAASWTAGGDKNKKKSCKKPTKKAAVAEKISLERVLIFIASISNANGMVARELCSHMTSPEEVEADVIRDCMKTLGSMKLDVPDKKEALEIIGMIGDVEVATEGCTKSALKNWNKFLEQVTGVLKATFISGEEGGGEGDGGGEGEGGGGEGDEGEGENENVHNEENEEPQPAVTNKKKTAAPPTTATATTAKKAPLKKKPSAPTPARKKPGPKATKTAFAIGQVIQSKFNLHVDPKGKDEEAEMLFKGTISKVYSVYTTFSSIPTDIDAVGKACSVSVGQKVKMKTGPGHVLRKVLTGRTYYDVDYVDGDCQTFVSGDLICVGNEEA